MLPSVSGLLDDAVRAGRIPGAVVTVASAEGVVHRSAHGVLDRATAHPLTTATVFWLASLSKIVGAATLLVLAEEGRLDLEDPVSKHLPEFGTGGHVRTLEPGSPSPLAAPFGPPPDPPPRFEVAPAERELTLVDLLTHTGGLQSLLVWNPEYVPPARGQTLAGYVPRLAGLVRDFQPGTRWAYSNAASFDVLSRVIEVASGQDLEAALRSRLLAPLGMRSTGFGGWRDPSAMPLPPAFAGDPVLDGTTYRTTSAGLWGTAEDYLKLAEMLRNRGTHDGRRLLSEESVRRMTTDQAGGLCPGLNGRAEAPGIGFGLSVAIVEDPVAAGEALPAGTFGWDGVGTRRCWVAPSWSLFLYAPDVEVQREIEAAVTVGFG